jgi:hypothetical protein
MTTLYCSPSCNNKDYKRAIREKQIAEFMEEEKKKTHKIDILGSKVEKPRAFDPRGQAVLTPAGKI